MSIASDRRATLVVALPDGTCAAFDAAVLAAARQRAVDLGFASRATAVAGTTSFEALVDSREMARRLGVGDTLVEAMARDGRIPSIRVGEKSLRFQPAAVLAALRGKA